MKYIYFAYVILLAVLCIKGLINFGSLVLFAVIPIILFLVLIVAGILFSPSNNDQLMESKFGKHFKEAIEKGELSETTAYPCTPESEFTSSKRINKKTKINLPDFKVVGCEESLRNFNGDFFGRAKIEFSEPISDEIIGMIQKRIQKGDDRWKMLDDEKIECQIYVPFEKGNDDKWWSVTIQKHSTSGEINYGRI